MTTTINASTTAGLVQTADTSGSLQLQTANTAALTIDTSQNVGIGTASPDRTLHVNAPSAVSITVSRNGGTNLNTGFQVKQATTSWYFGASPSNYFSIKYNDPDLSASPNMVIDTSGNVLVGKTASDLTVAGAEIRALGYGMFTVSGDYAVYARRNTSTGQVIAIRYAGTDTGSISTNGTNTAYATSSDYRLKENVLPMVNALEKVKKLNPVTYTWKETKENSEGFIAHELAEVCPHAVIGEKDAVDENGDIKPQGIDTSFLVATLTKAIQELSAKVDAQQQEINALKGTA
jgi:hypothetical protein